MLFSDKELDNVEMTVVRNVLDPGAFFFRVDAPGMIPHFYLSNEDRLRLIDLLVKGDENGGT